MFAYHPKVNICWLVLKSEYSPVSFEEKYLQSINFKNETKQPNNNNKIVQPEIKGLTQVLLAYNSKQRSEKC